jgi:hypothetical protein
MLADIRNFLAGKHYSKSTLMTNISIVEKKQQKTKKTVL